MTLEITEESHVDYGLRMAHIEFVKAAFADEPGGRVVVKELELPPELGRVPCGLYGPEMDDDPVPEYHTLTDAVHWETHTAQPPEELAEEMLLSKDKGLIANAGWIAIKRGERSWTSKVVPLPTRITLKLTVVAGPVDDKPLVWFSAYGGPEVPQEPGDPHCRERERSGKFWQTHALACGNDMALADRWIRLAARYTQTEAAHGDKR